MDMGLKRPVKEIFSKRIVHPIYNQFIRPYLPRKYASLNNVETKAVRMFDRTREIPDYDEPICSMIRSHISKEMSVVILGEKWGVKTVHVARQIGEKGSISIFDGDSEHLELTKDAAEKNGIECSIDYNHTIVGTPMRTSVHKWAGVRGGKTSANSVPVEALPECDALIINATGAELGLISELELVPEILIAKMYDPIVPGFEAAGKCLLDSRGYSIIDRKEQDTGVAVITARHE